MRRLTRDHQNRGMLLKGVCLFFIWYLLSRYMRPEGPWPRLRRAPRRFRTQKKKRSKGKAKGKYILPRAQPAFSSLLVHLPAKVLPSPKSQGNHPPHPRIPQAGKHCRSSTHVVEHQPHGRSPRPLPLAHPRDPFPHDSCLAGPCGAPGDEVEPGLSHHRHLSDRSFVSCHADTTQSIRGRTGTGRTLQANPSEAA